MIRVSDGDTLVLLVNGPKEIRVRLEGIDALASGQPWGAKAAQELSELVLNQTVKVLSIGEDRYGRTLGRIYLNVIGNTPDFEQEEIDVNAALVARGLAWHFKRCSDDEDLSEAELAARRERRGLWSEPNPTSP